jgi:hypothetical protein
MMRTDQVTHPTLFQRPTSDSFWKRPSRQRCELSDRRRLWIAWTETNQTLKLP